MKLESGGVGKVITWKSKALRFVGTGKMEGKGKEEGNWESEGKEERN